MKNQTSLAITSAGNNTGYFGFGEHENGKLDQLGQAYDMVSQLMRLSDLFHCQNHQETCLEYSASRGGEVCLPWVMVADDLGKGKQMQMGVLWNVPAYGSVSFGKTKPNIAHQEQCTVSKLSPGFDMRGQDLTQVAKTVKNATACGQACCATHGCQAFTYAVAPNNFGKCATGDDCCYLKRGRPSLQPSKYTNISSGFVNVPPVPMPTPKPAQPTPRPGPPSPKPAHPTHPPTPRPVHPTPPPTPIPASHAAHIWTG